MKDGIIKGTGNSRYLKSNIPADITLPALVSMLRAGTLPVDLAGINAAGWQQIGDALGKKNLLDDATAVLLGLPTTAKPNDAFQAVYKEPMLTTKLFTANTTFKMPKHKGNVDIRCFGGGGNGYTYQTHNGGGGGYMTSKSVAIPNDAVIPITIGYAGGQYLSDGLQHNNGGITSFGNYCSASGGFAGTQTTAGYGGTGGGSSTGKGGDGEYGGGGGSSNGQGGNGGTYGGGGGGGKIAPVGASARNGMFIGGKKRDFEGYGQAGGAAGYLEDGKDATDYAAGISGKGLDTTTIQLAFTGLGLAGKSGDRKNNNNLSGGGGGYGGDGGINSGGGGGYGGNGGSDYGGGGGYGGNGGSDYGGGGGYGQENYGRGGDGEDGGLKAKSGICMITYYAV